MDFYVNGTFVGSSRDFLAGGTGFGAYQLVYSNDLSETGLSGWTTILGRRAVADAGQFVGVDLLSQVRNDEIQPRQRF